MFLNSKVIFCKMLLHTFHFLFGFPYVTYTIIPLKVDTFNGIFLCRKAQKASHASFYALTGYKK